MIQYALTNWTAVSEVDRKPNAIENTLDAMRQQ